MRNSRTIPGLSPAAPSPPSLPTVCHYSNNFLPLSKTFIYGQIQSVTGVRQVVIAKQIVNPDLYPFDPVCCLTKPSGERSPLGEHRELWRRFLLEQDVRLIHAHFANGALDILPLAVRLGIPMIVSLYGNDIHRLGAVPRFVRDYQKLFRRAACLLAVCDGLRREAIRLGCPPEKVRMRHLGVALDRFAYEERGLAEGEGVRFLHVSNFVPKKGVPILIRAFRRVHAALPRTELLLAGQGSGVEECRRLVGELGLEGCVRFVGPLPPADMPRLMQSAHIYVQPSITPPDGSAEGIPCVITEAMATGMPVIGTRHAGIPEVVLDGRTGLLVEERDETGLAEKMTYLAAHPEVWPAFSRAAAADVRRRFDQRTQGALLSAAYSELALAGPARGSRPASPRPRTRLLITNSVALNGGDAAILLGMLRDIRRETNGDVRILVNDLPRVRPLFPSLKLLPALEEAGFSEGERPDYSPRPWWARKVRVAAGLWRRTGNFMMRLRGREAAVIRAYNECDVVVSAGGGYLTDNYISFFNKMCGFDVAAILRKPIVLYAHSFGPFRTRRGHRAARRLMKQAALVIVRDRTSYHQALAHGADSGKLHLTADAAFALPVVADGLPQEEEAPPSAGLNVGLSVREWGFYGQRDQRLALMAAYKEAMARLSEHLISRHGARLTFISTCQGIPGYADDSAVAAQIVSEIRPELREGVTLERGYFDPIALRRRLSVFDAFVGTRTHSVILAALSFVPAAGIACEQKTADLYEEFGLSEYVLSIEKADAEKYVEVVDRLIASREEVRRKLEERVPALIRRAHSSVGLLNEMLDRLPVRGSQTQ